MNWVWLPDPLPGIVMAENLQNRPAPAHPGYREARGRRKTAIGYVVSDKMEKTIVVELESRVQHPSSARSSGRPRRSRPTTRTARPVLAIRSRRWSPPAVGDQALAARRRPREGQVGAGSNVPTAPSGWWVFSFGTDEFDNLAVRQVAEHRNAYDSTDEQQHSRTASPRWSGLSRCFLWEVPAGAYEIRPTWRPAAP